MKKRSCELAPCGVLCAACPSYNKTCYGCASENKNQKRQSKWNCQIRQCCYDKMNVDYCGECNKFPCETVSRKLIKSHEGDSRYKYRHEIYENMKLINEIGVEGFIITKKNEFICKDCGGSIYFYDYKCNRCGKSISTLLLEE